MFERESPVDVLKGCASHARQLAEQYDGRAAEDEASAQKHRAMAQAERTAADQYLKAADQLANPEAPTVKKADW